jgi:hypothetical protein
VRISYFLLNRAQGFSGHARIKRRNGIDRELLAKELLDACIRRLRSRLRDSCAGFSLAPVFLI